MYEINRCIEIYLDFYNNSAVNRSTGSVPAQSNKVDEKLIKALKMQLSLFIYCAQERVT